MVINTCCPVQLIWIVFCFPICNPKQQRIIKIIVSFHANTLYKPINTNPGDFLSLRHNKLKKWIISPNINEFSPTAWPWSTIQCIVEFIQIQWNTDHDSEQHRFINSIKKSRSSNKHANSEKLIIWSFPGDKVRSGISLRWSWTRTTFYQHIWLDPYNVNWKWKKSVSWNPSRIPWLIMRAQVGPFH